MHIKLWEALMYRTDKNTVMIGAVRGESWRTKQMVSIEDTSWDDYQFLAVLPVGIEQQPPCQKWSIQGELHLPRQANWWIILLGIWNMNGEKQIQYAVGAELQGDRALEGPEVPNLGTLKVIWDLVIWQLLWFMHPLKYSLFIFALVIQKKFVSISCHGNTLNFHSLDFSVSLPTENECLVCLKGKIKVAFLLSFQNWPSTQP